MALLLDSIVSWLSRLPYGLLIGQTMTMSGNSLF